MALTSCIVCMNQSKMKLPLLLAKKCGHGARGADSAGLVAVSAAPAASGISRDTSGILL
jgi:hypothetical protein